jgi:hypothetical protein
MMISNLITQGKLDDVKKLMTRADLDQDRNGLELGFVCHYHHIIHLVILFR